MPVRVNGQPITSLVEVSDCIPLGHDLLVDRITGRVYPSFNGQGIGKTKAWRVRNPHMCSSTQAESLAHFTACKSGPVQQGAIVATHSVIGITLRLPPTHQTRRRWCANRWWRHAALARDVRVDNRLYLGRCQRPVVNRHLVNQTQETAVKVVCPATN